MPEQQHLILIGACYLDTILTVPFFPAEDSKLRATNLSVRRGGNCPNSLEVLQQLLSPDDTVIPYLVSCLPGADTAATRQIKESLGSANAIDFRHCLYREKHTAAASCYVLRNAQTDSRTVINYSDLPDMAVGEFERIARSFSPDQQTWWHFEGRIPDITLECIRLLREIHPRARISVEVEKPGREGLPELAAQADVVFYSRTWTETRGHGSPEACLKEEQVPRASLALCTWGSDGAVALSRPGDLLLRCPVARRSQVVDAVGAGDTFIGGMLYGLLCRSSDWETQEKVQFAVDLASLKVQREGFSGLGALVRDRTGSLS